MLSIVYISPLTIKYTNLSQFECDTVYGVHKFKLDVKEVTNELKLSQFILILRVYNRFENYKM